MEVVNTGEARFAFAERSNLAAGTVPLPKLEAFNPVKPSPPPTNSVDVILVAAVTTPASIIIVPSNTICCPLNGVISRSVPAVDEIVLPLILILST